jgi:CBS domain containing-hemolysin-like protein
MAMSSVSVVTNALRLRGFRRPKDADEILHPSLRSRVGEYAYLVAIALVAVNLVLAALGLSWAAKVSLTAIMAVSLGGFAVRMGLVTAVLFAVQDAEWVDMTALGITVLVTHLGLLFWELRFVSASLAFPGLKPAPDKEAVVS